MQKDLDDNDDKAFRLRAYVCTGKTLILLLSSWLCEVVCLIFISLLRDKKKPTKELTDRGTEMIDELEKKGVKILGFYWTLGQYDDVVIFEAPTEKDALKLAIDVKEDVDMETMVAIPREEAIKLL